MKKKRSLWSLIVSACCTVCYAYRPGHRSKAQVTRPRRKRPGRIGNLPEPWACLNFVAHQLFNGDRFRCLTIVENGSFC